MLTFQSCPFCIEARNILDKKGVKYDDVMIDKLAEGKAIRAELGKQFGQTSVPAVSDDSIFCLFTLINMMTDYN